MSAFNNFGIWNKWVSVNSEPPYEVYKRPYSEMIKRELLLDDKHVMFEDMNQLTAINKFFERIQIQNFLKLNTIKNILQYQEDNNIPIDEQQSFQRHLEILCILSPTIYRLIGYNHEAIELAIWAKTLCSKFSGFKILKLKLLFFLAKSYNVCIKQLRKNKCEV